MADVNKVVFIGNARVGKTSIINNYLSVSGVALPTVGASSQTISVSTGRDEITINLWDTAGQEEFKCLVPLYARGAQIAVVVFDVSDEETYDDVKNWIESAKYDYEILKIICVANKIDMKYDEGNMKEVTQYLEDKNIPLIKVSAKTGENVVELFKEIAKETYKKADPEIQVVEFNEPLSFNDSGCCGCCTLI